MTNMQIAIRLWWEAGDYFLGTPGSQIITNDLTDKV